MEKSNGFNFNGVINTAFSENGEDYNFISFYDDLNISFITSDFGDSYLVLNKPLLPNGHEKNEDYNEVLVVHDNDDLLDIIMAAFKTNTIIKIYLTHDSDIDNFRLIDLGLDVI